MNLCILQLLNNYLSNKNKCILVTCCKDFYNTIHINKIECMKEYLQNHGINIPNDITSLKISFVIAYELINNLKYHNNISYYDQLQKKVRKLICKLGHHSFDPDIDLRKNNMCYGICHYFKFKINYKDLIILILRQHPNTIKCMQSFIYSDDFQNVYFNYFDFNDLQDKIKRYFIPNCKIKYHGIKHKFLLNYIKII